ncbi:PREDICTED: unconventional myosin-Id-like [Priapulus caudatus]|uniref:Unconventional myosin-Id-like n=1 Tax=Priapulus caudatus TaxID=37621 RepID=A0ABM1E0I8_PRICU|nr:PREDICTED: unconventional myosin-Id-like [Priapulus caudatus]
MLFSCPVRKVNKFNKCESRAICVTDMYVYKLDPKKSFKLMKHGIPIQEITGVSVTPGTDSLVAIHLQGGNDLVVCLTGVSTSSGQSRAPEVVGALAQQWFKKTRRPLKVLVNNMVHCMLGNKSRAIGVQLANVAEPIFKKDGDDLVLQTPN